MKKKAWVFIFVIIVCLSNVTFSSIVTSDGPITRTYVYNSKVVYLNQGDGNLSLEADSHFFNVFLNTSGQTVYLLTVNKSDVWSLDYDGNPLLSIHVSPIPPEENVTLTIAMQIIKTKREPPNINILDSQNREDIPSELKEDYCQIEGSWLVDDEMLISLANDIWVSGGASENVLKIVTDLADWVGQNIDPVTHDVPLYPNETCILKEGDCDDQSNLLITLCRILGIPAYLQLGAMRKSGKDEGTHYDGHIKYLLIDIGYHGWAMIYIPPWGWLPFDMTLAWKENTLEGITSAPIWNLNAITMGNIMKSDWAGDSKRWKEELINSQLYLHQEDELITQDGDNLWETFLQMVPYGIFLILTTSTVLFFYTRWKGKPLNSFS